MQCCIPRKGDFIVLTDDIISSAGRQKLEFYSRNHPNFHSRQISFTLRKGEWYQIGSIYCMKSNIYMSLKIQRSRATRHWIKDRIKKEITKLSPLYDGDEPVLKSRSLECAASDLHKRCLVYHHAYEAIDVRSSINSNLIKDSRRWEQLDIQ